MTILIQMPSPSFDQRRAGAPIDILVLHYTGMQSCAAAVAQLTNPASKVSSHYTIDEDGTIYQHVQERDRAWHAGKSFWRGETDVNSRSIGIEIANPGHEFGYRRFPDVQIATVIELSKQIVARHSIPMFGIVGHSDVAPLRKEDPGELFPWKYLALSGLGPWPVDWRRDGGAAFGPGASSVRVRRAQCALAATGYDCPVTGVMDVRTVAVMRAFQRRFRQARVDGILDGECRGLIYALAQMAQRNA